jgi:two-component system chemotaxis response regulator CheY
MNKDLVFLVVDDDGQVRHILTEYLKSFGFEKILQAKDGMTALKIIQNHQQHIDFIISDWEMPQLDGLTLLKAVRNDTFRDEVKFIMVSSQSSRERMKISKAARSRVDAYVVKPFRAKVLQEKIATLLNGEIDSSVAEFEEMLQEVPSNEQRAKEKKGGTMGQVLLDQEQKGAGVIANLKRLAKTGPQKVKKSVGTAKIDASPKANVIPEALSQDYDLRTMKEEDVSKLAREFNNKALYDKTIRLCTDSHFLFPANADILFQLAFAYFAKADKITALYQLKKAIKIDPYHIEAQTMLSELTGPSKKVG